MSEIEGPIGIKIADIYLRFPEIMEEELDDLVEFLDDEHIVYEGATKKFKDLENQLKQANEGKEEQKRRKELIQKKRDKYKIKAYKLQQRIDKALQELDKYRINFDFPGFTDRTIENTRKILRGNDE